MSKRSRVALVLALVISMNGVSSARADWVSDGVAICTAAADQMGAGIVTDGLGGGIITWSDNRNGTFDIYAQRVDANGAVLWAADGVAVCTGTSSLFNYWLVSDGSGGAIVAWSDNRAGNNDIYAQRVGPNGSMLWATNGVAVCTADSSQEYRGLVSDGAGGAVIAWTDERNGSDYDIYAQRIDASGAALWATNGVAITTAGGDQDFLNIVSDGSGGAIIVWPDGMPGHIFGQRIDGNGLVQWAANGALICPVGNNQRAPELAPDGSGGAIVIWLDESAGGSLIHAQRVAANGSSLWTDGGVLVRSTAIYSSGVPAIVPDGAGGGIITWYDNLANGNYDVFAQRIDSNGSVLWTADGVAVCTVQGSQEFPALVPDGDGGAVITWMDLRTYSQRDIYAQKIEANGSVAWDVSGIPVCTASGNQYNPGLIADGGGGAIVAWYDRRSGASDIYAQRIDAAGHTVVATLLLDYSAAYFEDGIRLTWTLSDVDTDVRFFVERAGSQEGPFAELPASRPAKEGLSFTFIDRDVNPGETYKYRVEYSMDSERKILFESGPVSIPSMPVRLYQNSPNPFNPSTEIRYYVPERCSVTLDIYDVNGALVARLSSGYRDKGPHTVSWDGRDRNGRQASSGVYFYRLKAGKAESSKKMVLVL